jgi:hypothetical protein
MSPDAALIGTLDKVSNDGRVTKEDLLAEIRKMRDEDPDFLEAIGPENRSQLTSVTSGANYEIGRRYDACQSPIHSNPVTVTAHSMWVGHNLTQLRSLVVTVSTLVNGATCGLTVRRPRHRINPSNQVFMHFSIGSGFWHLMGVSAL